jgi:hypothetical protein
MCSFIQKENLKLWKILIHFGNGKIAYRDQWFTLCYAVGRLVQSGALWLSAHHSVEENSRGLSLGK